MADVYDLVLVTPDGANEKEMLYCMECSRPQREACVVISHHGATIDEVLCVKCAKEHGHANGER